MRQNQIRSNAIKTLGLIGSYVPRRCGIATFTKDLFEGLVSRVGSKQVAVVALDDVTQGYDYPDEVRYQIRAHRPAEYAAAADMFNIKQIDVAIIQHEYGIFGGPDGKYILDLMRRLRTSIVTNLHTVLTEPTPGQHAVMQELASLSDRLVVMSRMARSILKDVYAVPAEKIGFIPHGIPDVPFVDPHFYKDQYGVEGRTVLLTFGLMSPDKGIEVAIKALPKIVERHPDVIYIVLGATHPHVLECDGDVYRQQLERLVDQLDLRDHVIIINQFVTLSELCGYIGSADLYITPYRHESQITSGTLVYALGAGKAVLSTPYWCAQEMLADGRGRLFPFDDSDRLAVLINELLASDLERHAMRKRAYLYCRPMAWNKVAQSYLDLADEVIDERNGIPRPVSGFRPKSPRATSRPAVKMDHLRRLTDDTGIAQHAMYAVPDRHHGYCTDDNCRALITVLLEYDLHRDESMLQLADIYLSFLHYAFDPDHKRFHNFMGFDRTWQDEVGSEDAHGRAIWSLGVAAAMAPNDSVLTHSVRLFQAALENIGTFTYPRAMAFALVGIHAYLQRFGGDSYVRRLRTSLAMSLHDRFASHATEDWPWCDSIVTYDNAKLPHALILAGQWIPDHDMLQQGLRSLEWLVDIQTLDDKVSLIGNDGWMQRDGHRARFDQQPIEAMAMIDASAEAYRCTKNSIWIERANRFLGWFLGNNDTNSMLYDERSGGCRDGLRPNGPNLNEGAESTISWLLSLLTVLDLEHTTGTPECDRPVKQVPRSPRPTIRLESPPSYTSIIG